MDFEHENILELQKSAKILPLYCNVLILVLHNICMGVSFYFTSVTLPYHKVGSEGYLVLTEEETSWYLSLHQISSLAGSLLGNPCGERLGRKTTLLLSNVLTILSYTAIHLAPNFPLLLTGRIISGVSGGIGIVLPIVLLGEIATIKHRSGLANTVNLFINLGCVTIYAVNMFLPPNLLPFVPIGLSAAFLISSFGLTESPHWMIRKGKIERASKALRQLRGAGYEGVEDEIKEVLKVIEINAQTKRAESRWKSPTFLQPLAIIFVIFSTIGFSGVDAPMSLYGPRMFAEFGFNIPYQYIIICIPLGSFFGYIFSCGLLVVIKKKTQILGACFTMATASGLVGLAYWLKDNKAHLDAEAKAVLVAGSIGLTFGYGGGLGSIAYTLPGELFNPEDTTIGYAVAEASRMIWTALIMKMYPACLAMVSYPGMFAFHSTALILAALFIIRYLPETKNKSLSELQSLFNKNTQLPANL